MHGHVVKTNLLKTSQELFSHQDNQLKVAALSGSGEGGLHVKKMYISVNISCKQT